MNKQQRNLEALSRIDEKIVDWSSRKRAEYQGRSRKKPSRKKWYIAGGSIAAALLLILSTVLMLVNLLGKQVPIYTGMTVSSTSPVVSASVDTDAFLANNGNGDNGLHKGHYKGDCTDDREEEPDAFEKPLESTLTVLGGGEARYYANAGEDVYITIHINNPDSFEILSFTLNGEKYSSYMFEPGSDMEHLILKVNVGAAEGVIEYTIDAIKYVDGTEIKDVRMEGDRTVEIGVYTEKQPTAAVSGEAIGYNTLSFVVSAADLMDLVADSAGKLEAVLYDGDSILQRQEIATVGNTTVSFTGLKTNAPYQYAIVAYYDALDGKGYSSYVLAERAFYTKATVLFDEIVLSTTGIRFSLLWDNDYSDDRVLSKLELYQNDVKVAEPGVTAGEVSALLPDTAYLLVAEYWNGSAKESISLEFTTDPLVYTVTHLKENLDGSWETAASASEIIALNATVTPAVHQYTGFTTPQTQSVTGSVNGALNVTYYYPRTVYTMTLVRNDGAQPDEMQLKYGQEIPGDVRDLFGGWFADETLTELVYTVPAENKTLYAKWDNWTSADLLTYTGLDTLTITGLKSGVSVTELVVPAYIGGKRVSAVADRAFYGLSALAAATVPTTVEQLGQNAFGGCNGLGSLTLPFVGASANGTVAAYIGYLFGAARAEDNNYYVPSALKSVTLNGTAAVPSNAFVGCTWLQSVTIGAGVPSIGDFAFVGCTGLTTLNTAGATALAAIGESAFSGCAALTSLTIPENVNAIGTAAFENCTRLTEIFFNAIAMGDLANDTFSAAGTAGQGIAVTFGAGVTRVPKKIFAHFSVEGKTSPNIKSISFATGSVCKEIGIDAFANCVILSSVSLPDGLEKINAGAFYNNDALTEITIPASVTEIRNNAFSTCALLERVIFGTGSQLKTLDFTVFGTCPMLKTVNLPNTLSSIGNYAFNGCTSLSAIVIPAGVTSLGDYVFKGCTALETVEIRGNIGTLGRSAFQSCTSLTSVLISGQVTSINEQAFSDCTLLATVVLPAGLEQIGKRAFYNCTALSNVALGTGLVQIGYECFYNCTSLTGIVLPETLTTVEAFAFFNTGLTSVTLPASVVNVYAQAFENCTSLVSVEFKGEQISRLYYGVFRGCRKLESIVIPDSVTALADYVFSKCTSLKGITIPSTVASIGKEVFYGCTSLATLTFEQGSVLTSVGTNAFSSCPIQTAKIPAMVATSIPKNALKTVEVFSGEELPANAFKSGFFLTSVKLCDSLKSIGDNAFNNCTQLTEIKLPSSLTSIGASAFVYCTGLTEIELPSGVETLGASAFSNCWKLESVTLSDRVGALPEKLFEKCSSLAEINIPAGVRSVGASAFSGCSALTRVNYLGRYLDEWCEINFADAAANPLSLTGALYINDVNVTAGAVEFAYMSSFGSYALYGCTGITELYIDIDLHGNLPKFGTNAFGGVAPTKAVIPAAVISQIAKYNLKRLVINGGDLQDGALADCTVLESISFSIPERSWYFSDLFSTLAHDNGFEVLSALVPATLKEVRITGGYIGSDAFRECKNITSVWIESNVDYYIDMYAFYGCTSLETVVIQGQQMATSYAAFGCCTSLTTIVMPAVASIHYETFDYCPNLKTVYYGGTEQEWEEFYAELDTEGNGDFVNATRYYYSEKEPTTEGNYWHYVNGVPTVW